MANTSILQVTGDLAASATAGAVSQLMPSGTVLPFAGVNVPAGWLLCDGTAISRTTYASLYSSIGTAWGSGDGSSTFNLPDLRGRFMRGRDGGAGRDPDRANRGAANAGGNTGDNVGSVQDNATGTNGLAAAGSAVTTSVSGASSQFNNGTGYVSNDHAHYTTTGGTNANHNHGYTNNSATDRVQGGLDNGVHWGLWGYAENTGGQSNDHAHGGWSGGANSNHTHGISWGGSFSASGTTPAGGIGLTGDNETRPKNANVHYIIKV